VTNANIKLCIPTADESNHSAMGIQHPQRSAMCVLYVTLVTLHCLIPQKQKKFAPSVTEDINPQSSIGTMEK